MKSKIGSQFDADDVNLMSNNLLRLEIFYREFNYEKIQETPAYQVHSRSLFVHVFMPCLHFKYISYYAQFNMRHVMTEYIRVRLKHTTTKTRMFQKQLSISQRKFARTVWVFFANFMTFRYQSGKTEIHCLKKVPTFKLSVSQILTDYQNFCTAWKRMKFATKPIRHYPPHLRRAATLLLHISSSPDHFTYTVVSVELLGNSPQICSMPNS